jgi:transcriptional regulator with GAF, ATPase, and Fis domain
LIFGGPVVEKRVRFKRWVLIKEVINGIMLWFRYTSAGREKMGDSKSGGKYKRRDLAGTIEVLFEISDAVTHTRNLPELYKAIHQSLDKILNVDNFFIALLDEKRDAIIFPYHVDEKNDIPEEILNFSKEFTFTGRIIKQKSPLIFYENDYVEMVRKKGNNFPGKRAFSAANAYESLPHATPENGVIP